MQGKLKQRYQVHKEVSRRGYFEGNINLVELPRLSELLTSKEGEITARFEFLMSDYATPMVSGKLRSSFQIECQRCLQAMPSDLQLDFSLLIDAADDIVRESSLDTLYSEAGYIDILEVIEDEIILALPLVAMHENDSCNEHWLAAEQTPQPAVRENPFSILKDLKTTH